MDLYGFILRATIRFIIINESADFRSTRTKHAEREAIFPHERIRRCNVDDERVGLICKAVYIVYTMKDL